MFPGIKAINNENIFSPIITVCIWHIIALIVTQKSLVIGACWTNMLGRKKYYFDHINFKVKLLETLFILILHESVSISATELVRSIT